MFYYRPRRRRTTTTTEAYDDEYDSSGDDTDDREDETNDKEDNEETHSVTGIKFEIPASESGRIESNNRTTNESGKSNGYPYGIVNVPWRRCQANSKDELCQDESK